jgi:hypothetical protein
MCRLGYVDDATTIMGQDHQHEQQSIRRGWYDKEISGDDLMHMIGEKRPRRTAATNIVNPARLPTVAGAAPF